MRWPSPTTLARIACGVAAVLTVCVAVLVVLLYGGSYKPTQSLLGGGPDLLTALTFATVGSIVLLGRPGNLVGWALCLAGIGNLLGGALSAYGELALLARPEWGLPGGAAAGAIQGGTWTALMAGVFLLLVAFPSGRLPSPRRRRVVLFVLACFAVSWIGISTAPGHLDAPLQAYENPLAVTSSKSYLTAVYPIVGLCLAGVAVAAGISLLVRFRRSRGEERQQFKWLAASAALLLVTLPIAGAFNYSDAAGAPFGVALFALPISVGIAILRYRLFEIDRIVNRTIVYGVLSALLAGLYFGIVVGLQAVFSGLTRGNDLAIAGSTLAVAALFRPARVQIQGIVDRRFYRRRYDSRQTLDAFGARLRDQIDLETLDSELRRVVAETMQPSHVSLWLRGEPD